MKFVFAIHPTAWYTKNRNHNRAPRRRKDDKYMELSEFLDAMNRGERVTGGSPAHETMTRLAHEAQKVTARINAGYQIGRASCRERV